MVKWAIAKKLLATSVKRLGLAFRKFRSSVFSVHSTTELTSGVVLPPVSILCTVGFLSVFCRVTPVMSMLSLSTVSLNLKVRTPVVKEKSKESRLGLCRSAMWVLICTVSSCEGFLAVS